MSANKKMGISILIFSGLVLLSYLLFKFFNNSIGKDFDEKSAFSVLQRIEFEHRNDKNISGPLIVEEKSLGNYAALGMPALDQDYPYVWVILNFSVGREPVVIPENLAFLLKCDYLKKIKIDKKVDKNVIQFLSEKCSI